MNLKINPTQQITLILAALAVGGAVANPKLQLLWHLVATLGFGLALFAILKFITKKPKNIYNTIISCLIIFLVLGYGDETNYLIYALVATFIAIFSKFFFEPKAMPIINPVVLGLLVTYWGSKFLSSIPAFISWWGVSYKIAVPGLSFAIPLSMILVLTWIIFGLKKWRKWPTFLSFILIYFLAILAFYQSVEGFTKLDTLKFIFTDSTIYFYAAVMLIEPKTSPYPTKDQIVFGFIAAVLFSFYFFFGFPQLDIMAIAIANLYFFGSKYLKSQKAVPATPTPPLNNASL